TAQRGARASVATVLAHARAPATTIAVPLDAVVAARFAVRDFTFGPAAGADTSRARLVRIGGDPVLSVAAVPEPTDATHARAIDDERHLAGGVLLFLLMSFLVASWARRAPLTARLLSLLVPVGVVLLVPLSVFSNVSVLFDPAVYWATALGRSTSTITSLAITAAAGLAAALAIVRTRAATIGRVGAALGLVLVSGLGPFLLRDLARGVVVPPNGATLTLWVAWELTIFLAALVVLLSGVTFGRRVAEGWRVVPPFAAPALAALAALMAPLFLYGAARLPAWYPTLWVFAILGLALSRGRRRALRSIAFVAACGSVTLVWSATMRGRVRLAESDIGGLAVADQGTPALLERFAATLTPEDAPTDRVLLLDRYAPSDLAAARLPVVLTAWDSLARVTGELRVGMAAGSTTGLDVFAREALALQRPVVRAVPSAIGVQWVLAVPHAGRRVTTVVAAPRTRLVPGDAFGAFVGFSPPTAAEPPYTLSVGVTDSGTVPETNAKWTRHGDEIHGYRVVDMVGGRTQRVHARVEIRSLESLATRGTLLVVLDLLAFALFWGALAAADGMLGRWWRANRGRWVRSFRARLTVGLFAFAMVPVVAFAIWSYERLQADDAQSRDLLVRETLRGVAAVSDVGRLADAAARFDTPLLLYADGMLIASSDPVWDALAPMGRLVPPAVTRVLGEGEEPTAGVELSVGALTARLGFRAADDARGVRYVLAAPARDDVLALDRRRRDLAMLVLLATVLGATAALSLSGVVARTLAQPLVDLQRGARAIARGERDPGLGDAPTEFAPVFAAFTRMARDLAAGRAESERAQRVIAWGEMARQVAHEIKNPLTPMRLGMQHLLRARADQRVDFDRVLAENTQRVLAEIDRLDEIARSFSRYGTAPEEAREVEAIDVTAIVRDVLALEQLGESEVVWTLDAPEAPLFARARADGLRVILINLLENARLAEARAVRVRVAADAVGGVVLEVADDGVGIAAEHAPRVFEPRFSTRTSGSGLGLAISRRLIEAWAGRIEVESTVGAGTMMRVTLAPAPRG
ncbi:MAG: HAMP domain-containing histidine kinase, partial [Gemmatimonadaceae bacterium]|nr:HAMP domain-containing histidine kinase [Gemmatimonadaceae bacterium]